MVMWIPWKNSWHVSEKAMSHRLSVIGLDGATFRLILPLVEAGKLPVLGKLMEQGAWGQLESTIHPLSPQAWASFMTGKNPGKHGIFEFVEHKPNSYDLRYVNGGFVRGKKLWELLSDAGKRVCIINVPLTYPPCEVNGCLIAGLDSPSIGSDFCYPPQLLDEITRKFGEYQLRKHPYKATPGRYLEKIFDQFDYTLKVASHLKEKEQWDLFMVVFEATDLVQHFYWHYAFPEEFGIRPTEDETLRKAIHNVYERIDAGLSEMLDLSDTKETVVIMSDHGFSSCRKIFFMDGWLHEQGYLAYRTKRQRCHTLTRVLHRGFQRYFPNKLKGSVTSLVPNLRDQLRSYLTTATIDWPRTRAFSLGIDSTNIFVNAKSRFPEGIVEEGAEYEDLIEELVERLAGLVDPATGENIVQRVFRREELYHGDSLNKAPDMLVTWKNYEYNTRRGYGKEAGGFLGSSLDFSDVSSYSCLQKSGTHHLEGIFIAKGPEIMDKSSFHGARIIDLAPTILYLLGQAIPEDMDGRIIEGIIGDSYLAANPIRFDHIGDLVRPTEETAYSTQEEKDVRERLQGLGYID
jgi:predicted AlkP superfamily phosphohydrolase/phosphomutase